MASVDNLRLWHAHTFCPSWQKAAVATVNRTPGLKMTVLQLQSCALPTELLRPWNGVQKRNIYTIDINFTQKIFVSSSFYFERDPFVKQIIDTT